MPHPPAPPAITDARDAAVLFVELADGDQERAAVVYLDPEWRILGRSDFAGTDRDVAPPLRTILAEALRLDAAALLLGHSHPSGCSAPSDADIAYTRALNRAAAALDIMLVDHVIVTDGTVTSLRKAGLL